MRRYTPGNFQPRAAGTNPLDSLQQFLRFGTFEQVGDLVVAFHKHLHYFGAAINKSRKKYDPELWKFLMQLAGNLNANMLLEIRPLIAFLRQDNINHRHIRRKGFHHPQAGLQAVSFSQFHMMRCQVFAHRTAHCPIIFHKQHFQNRGHVHISSIVG